MARDVTSPFGRRGARRTAVNPIQALTANKCSMFLRRGRLSTFLLQAGPSHITMTRRGRA
jgi:hypothetical protein